MANDSAINRWLGMSTWHRINLNYYAGSYVAEAYEHDLITRENRLIAAGTAPSYEQALADLDQKLAPILGGS